MELSNLPPDPDGMNEQRSAWALEPLRVFMSCTRQTDDNDAIVDLVVDLMHLADRRGMDGPGMLKMAERHYS